MQTVMVTQGNTIVHVIAFQGDWVVYKGETQENSIWKKNVVMHFNGLQWEKVDPKAKGVIALYMSSIIDIYKDTDNTVAATVFCELLMAQQGFIDELQAKVIKLGFIDDTDKGILLDGENGEIKSYDYMSTKN